jgi:hypothetical protein
MNNPNFQNPSDVCRWHGEMILQYLDRASREKALSRLRALNNALDTWSKLYRLSSDTQELTELKNQLDELRRRIDGERIGPRVINQ